MEHIVRFLPAHDCIKFECKFGSKSCYPGSGGSHGIHGVEIIFLSKGEKGVVQFVIFSDWRAQRKEADRIEYRNIVKWGGDYFMVADLGYHSPVPLYEGQPVSSKRCEYLGGKPCYYDESGLNAVDAMYSLVNGGDEGLWEFLDAYYESVFEGKEYPKAVEYPAPLRKEKP